MIDELPACYGHKLRKARKDHKCCECRGVIPKGEVYHYHHGVWDGQGSSYKVCVDCELLRTEVDKDLDCWEEGTYFGGLGESVFEGDVRGQMKRYIEIKQQRGAGVKEWMIERMMEAK